MQTLLYLGLISFWDVLIIACGYGLFLYVIIRFIVRPLIQAISKKN